MSGLLHSRQLTRTSGGTPGSCQVCCILTGSLEGHQDFVRSVAFSPDHKHLWRDIRILSGLLHSHQITGGTSGFCQVCCILARSQALELGSSDNMILLLDQDLVLAPLVTVNTLYAPMRRYPVCFSSPLVLYCYSTYARLIRTPSFHYDYRLLYRPLFDPRYCSTYIRYLVPVTSHLYSLIRYALDPRMYINPCT